MSAVLKLFILVFASAIAAGCASTYGNKINTTDVTFIRKGETTKNELIKRLNEPSDQMRDANGNETLIWSYTKTTTDGVGMVPVAGLFFGKQDVESQSLIVSLTKSGVVKDYTLGDDQKTIRLLDNKTVK